MKKKYYVIGISCILLLIAGVCYSCSFRADSSGDTLISDLSGSEQETNIISDPSSAPDLIDTIDAKTVSDTASGADQPEKHIIYVHLCGSVQKPGVYQVSSGARVIDVIDLAGGLQETAAGDYVNQAQLVQDGQRIYIPSLDEVKEQKVEVLSALNPTEQSVDVSTKQLLNINTADQRELMELPGIGEAKAADIIEYRTTNGSFENVEELMKIPGIKEGLFHKVSSLITVN